jgi:CheY-like chemotaxis protein
MALESEGTSRGRQFPFEILLIEDDDDYRDVVRELLEEEGYRVATARNGHHALEQLRSVPPPDLILTDLWMPVMDGWAFVAAVKELSTLARIPVVVSSGGGDRIPPPCEAYLHKPITRALLLQTLAACLSASGRTCA